jgi:DNA-binding NarL/FixJ family response regulator
VIRVVVVDDHALLRESLTRLIDGADDVEVVGAAANGREGVELVDRLAPDVVLMDLEMPELDGIGASAEITKRHPSTSVVILTTFAERDNIIDALDAGAVGYLVKDAEPEEIVRGVRAAARGESPLAPRAARTVLAERGARRPADALTARAREVLALLAEGLPNKLIARDLGISQKTVKNYLTTIFQHIGVTDRTQAALWATRHHIGRRS